MINVQPVITGIKTMIDMFSLQFMQNAFLAGMMLSFVLAVVSFFVVLRRLSFIGVGVAHSAFGGVALGALLGISPTLTAIGFAVVVSNAIGYIGKKGHLGTDTAIGIFFPLAMAMGVIFIGRSFWVSFWKHSGNHQTRFDCHCSLRRVGTPFNSAVF